MTTPELNARILHRVEIAPGLIILRVAPKGWELPPFTPGQFAVLGLPARAPRHGLCDPEDAPARPGRLIRRAYSIASSSVDREYLEFYVTLVRSGALTPRLWALGAGEPVWLGPRITGMFTLDDVPGDAHVVLVATGTGVAPYMSMLRTHLAHQNGRRYAVFHGARHSWDLGYHSELMSLQRICPALTYLPVVSRPGEEPVPWRGHTGYVQELWRRGHLDREWGFTPRPDNTHIFLCGNPAMIDQATSLLGEDGFTEHTQKTPGQVHVERYW